MANLMQLEIVTPEKMLLTKDDVQTVSFFTEVGSIGIEARHLPFIGALRPAPFKYTDGEGKSSYIYIEGGFLEFKNNKVTVLCTSAVNPEDIDVEAAKAVAAKAGVPKEELRLAKAKLRTAELAGVH